MGIESAAAAWAIGIAAAGTVASTVVSATQDGPDVPSLPEPPTEQDAEEEAEERVRRIGAIGKEQTKVAGLLTEEAETERKTLLGE